MSYFPAGHYSSGEITYRWICSRCNKTEEQARRFRRGESIWIPQPMPEGWSKVNGLLFCKDHEVRVSIDGQDIGETSCQVTTPS